MKIVVPGVNKILGGFTTLCKGLALCTLDDKQLIFDFKKRSDGYVKILMAKTGECKKFQTGNTKIKKEDKYCNAVKGIYSVLACSFKNLPGCDITLDGDLLDCEGHIVYSAVAIAAIKALSHELKKDFSNAEIAELVDSALKTVGETGNLSDIITILNAKRNQFVVFNGSNRCYKIFDNPFEGSSYSLLIVDGHVPTGPLKEEATIRSKDIITANQTFIGAYSFCKIAALSSSEFREKLQGADDETKSLCTYLFEATKAVLNIESIVENRDIESIGRILAKIKNTAEEYLEIICPEIDWVVKRAYETRGCVGACTFFEGFCTKAAVIIKRDAVEQFMSNIEEYQHIFGFGFSIDVIS